MNAQVDLRRRTLLLAAAAGLLDGFGPALAAEDQIFFSSGTLGKEAPGDPPGLYVNASFTMHLSSAVNESLLRGVALYFVSEFVLTQRRWYWKDKTVASAVITKRLSYSLLTRKYNIGGAGPYCPISGAGLLRPRMPFMAISMIIRPLCDCSSTETVFPAHSNWDSATGK